MASELTILSSMYSDYLTGAKADVRNKEGKLAYDLASKDPATAALLQPHIPSKSKIFYAI